MDGDGALDLLAKVLRNTPSLPGSLCLDDPRLFDGDNDGDTAEAIAVCHRCPAFDACAEWAARRRRWRLQGVVAGVRHPRPRGRQPKYSESERTSA